jgi:hypothetical protein
MPGSSFSKSAGLSSIIVESGCEIIKREAFDHWASRREIDFTPPIKVNPISGLNGCTSLCRIEIPSSVEIIDGFNCSTSLNELIFSTASHVTQINGFCGCTSLCRIEIPSSVEIVSGFRGCTSLHVVIVQARCRLSQNQGFCNIKPFIVQR